MWKLSSLIACLVLVASCDTAGPPLLTECEPGTITLEVRIMSLEDINETFPGERAPGDQMRGYTILPADPARPPTIVVAPIRGQGDRETMYRWGHELAHAVCGLWHEEGAVL